MGRSSALTALLRLRRESTLCQNVKRPGQTPEVANVKMFPNQKGNDGPDRLPFGIRSSCPGEHGDSGMITTILGSIAFLVIFAGVVRVIWDTLVIAYSTFMVAIYGTAYVVITIWEILVWILSLPFRLVRWSLHLRTRE